MLLKAVLANVTALITQPMGQGLAPGFRSEVNLRNGAQGQARQQDPANIPLPNPVDPSELPIDDIEALRSREITAKAVSGILLILLKWFKVSRKFIPAGVVLPLTFNRYSQIRVPHPTSVGLELPAPRLETFRTPRNRQGR